MTPPDMTPLFRSAYESADMYALSVMRDVLADGKARNIAFSEFESRIQDGMVSVAFDKASWLIDEDKPIKVKTGKWLVSTVTPTSARIAIDRIANKHE